MKAISILISLALPLIMNSQTASAHETETLYNVIHLQAEANREIPNDQMLVVLATEHQGNEPANVSQDINKDMQWALEIVSKHKEVVGKTGNYQTYPVYNKQTITGWRSSQQIELRSENLEELTELVGILQQRLQVKQMSFSPKDSSYQQHENELIEEAMEAFRERIGIIGKHMEQKNHRIVNLNVNTGRYQPPVMFERAAMKTMAMDTVAPAVESGSSKITVTINGSVQFF